jgi:Cullin family
LAETVFVSLQPHQITCSSNNNINDSSNGDGSSSAAAATAAMGLLQELKHHWINHKIMNELLRKLFTHLDGSYVKRNRLPHLLQVGLLAFRQHIYLPYQHEITRAFLQLIALARAEQQSSIKTDSNSSSSGGSNHSNGSKVIIDKSVVKSIIDLYKNMTSVAPPPGIVNIDNNNDRNHIRPRPTPPPPDLEQSFLKATCKCYAHKRQELTNPSQHGNVLLSLPQYLVKVNQELLQERNFIVECRGNGIGRKYGPVVARKGMPSVA